MKQQVDNTKELEPNQGNEYSYDSRELQLEYSSDKAHIGELKLVLKAMRPRILKSLLRRRDVLLFFVISAVGGLLFSYFLLHSFPGIFSVWLF